MGIHGEPGIWNGPIKTADELARRPWRRSSRTLPLVADDEVALLVNGLGATSVEELYILTGSGPARQLEARGIKVYRSWTGDMPPRWR